MEVLIEEGLLFLGPEEAALAQSRLVDVSLRVADRQVGCVDLLQLLSTHVSHPASNLSSALRLTRDKPPHWVGGAFDLCAGGRLKSGVIPQYPS